MKFTGKFKAPRLALANYQKRLATTLNTAIAEAAAEWLGAVLNKVPVWSGASQATFLPLARAIDYALTIQPVLSAKRSRVNLGLQKSDGVVVADPVAGKFHFHYETSLEHLIHNEFHNANVDPDPTKFKGVDLINPGPYEFQKLGQQAFERYAAGVSLPDPFLSLRVQTIRVK